MKHFLIDATACAPQNPTGVGRLVQQVAGRLFDRDSENDYLAFGFAREIWPPARLPPHAVYRRIKPWTALGPLAMEASRRAFVAWRVARWKTDLLWCPLDMTPLYDERTRVLYSLHDLARLTPEHHHGAAPGLRDRLRTTLRYRLARRADLLHTISNFSAEEIAARLGIDRGKIRVIYPGADPLFTAGEPEAAVLARFELTAGKYFLFVGQLGRQKNEDGLIEAFLAAQRDNGLADDVRLALVGDAAAMRFGTRRQLQGEAGRRGVTLLGRVADADLLQLYRGAIAVTLPSFHEGFGLPVVEAMACGAPSIVSDATSLPEVAGDAGLIVPAGRAAELAAALARLAGDAALRARLAERAGERAKLFTFERMAAEMHRLFCEMTDG